MNRPASNRAHGWSPTFVYPCPSAFIWYVMISSTNPSDCNVSDSPKGNEVGRAAGMPGGAILLMKFGGYEDASRSVKRIRNNPVTQNLRVATLSDESKPAPVVKWFPRATTGLSGVKGNSAHRRIGWEHERSVRAEGACVPHPSRGSNNPAWSSGWKSEGLIVAMKRVTTVEQRSPDAEEADSEVSVGRLV